MPFKSRLTPCRMTGWILSATPLVLLYIAVTILYVLTFVSNPCCDELAEQIRRIPKATSENLVNNDKGSRVKRLTHSCASSQFRCDDGHCIPFTFVCDLHQRDCVGGEDERNCHSNVCNEEQYQCPSGKCIPRYWVCDTTNDCPDGADETQLYCQRRQCATGQFRCNTGSCLPIPFSCDGETDCKDGEDELNCPGCLSNEFQCRDGQCILSTEICNRQNDCSSGEDELNCRGCLSNEFLCRDDRCILSTQICNRQNDCPSGEDELNCPTRCSVYQLQCGSKCVSVDHLCDGVADCVQGEDEIPATCNEFEELGNCDPHYQFACYNGRCLSREYACDSIPHCLGGEDERLCYQQGNCDPHYEFECYNGRCLSLMYACDGVPDCLGGEDERLCYQQGNNRGRNGVQIGPVDPSVVKELSRKFTLLKEKVQMLKEKVQMLQGPLGEADALRVDLEQVIMECMTTLNDIFGTIGQDDTNTLPQPATEPPSSEMTEQPALTRPPSLPFPPRPSANSPPQENPSGDDEMTPQRRSFMKIDEALREEKQLAVKSTNENPSKKKTQKQDNFVSYRKRQLKKLMLKKNNNSLG